jgi:hypothetical protein
VKEPTDSGTPADEAGQVALFEEVDELKRARDAVGEDALVSPNGEAEKDGCFPTALSDDGEGVAEVFEDVVAGCQGNVSTRQISQRDTCPRSSGLRA